MDYVVDLTLRLSKEDTLDLRKVNGSQWLLHANGKGIYYFGMFFRDWEKMNIRRRVSGGVTFRVPSSVRAVYLFENGGFRNPGAYL